MDSMPDEADLDRVLDRRRRRVLASLRGRPERSCTLRELVDDLRTGRARPDPDREPGRETLAIRLHHHDLPKLEAYGVIEYDAAAGRVTYRPDPGVESLLESLAEECRQTER